MIHYSSKPAQDLFHQGALALADVEHNGIRVDTEYLDRATKRLTKQIKQAERDLKNTKEFKVWKRMFDSPKLRSHSQLGKVIFKGLGVPYPKEFGVTKNLEYRTSEKVFEKVELQFIKDYIHWRKLEKAKRTYLDGISREVVNGRIHPFCNLNIARSFRSSMDSPNFQNMPKRLEEFAEIVRRIFIPDDGHVLLELDFKAIEVSVAACYNKDPVLIKYVSGQGDMHEDMAMECYLLPREEVSKDVRFFGKNGFVFPEFYGDFYPRCARALWDAIEKGSLCLKNKRTPLLKHLKRRGITGLGDCDPERDPRPGTFEDHIKRVERRFWERLKVYKQWKYEFYQAYLDSGSFKLYTDFVINGGRYSRNQVVNYPIQGSAFHILLWTLVQLNKWLRENRMKSKICGQIHDSILLSVLKREFDRVLAKAVEIATVLVRKHWKWIIVPLVVEAEKSETNWYEKKEIKLAS